MPRPKSCCVFACDDLVSSRHRFPKNDEETFKVWVKVVKHPRFATLTPEEIYKSYYVCNRHFSEDAQVKGTRRGLKMGAIPTLYMPDSSYDESDNATADSPPPKKMKQDKIPIVDETNMAIGSIALDLEEPSTSKVHIGNSERPAVTGIPEFPVITFEKDDNLENNPSGQFLLGNSKSRKALFQSGSKSRRQILQSISVTRQNQLTPKAKTLYRMVGKWGAKAAAAARKIKSYRARLAEAEKISNSTSFDKLIDHVNETPYKFIMCQVRNQKLPPRGRRFTMEEKILALSILKSSGKGYRFLSKIFVLPSRRTLTELLNKIPLKPGINKQIFQSLKHSVEKMNTKDKCCVIMFDEVAIDSTLQYNRKEDYVEGIEDFGTERNGKLADHANVFMLKGVYRQWVQPVSFTFSSGPIKSDRLVGLLKQVVHECNKLGLDIIASVCDQGAANVAAINKLMAETSEQCLQKKEQNTYFGYIIDNKEIVPLFDVPHLFKGIRNNLLNKNLHFSINGKDMEAKWEHIIQFYLLDISDNTRICPKLTDRHVIPEKINKMKVSACTQIFSNTVGSLMKRIATWNVEHQYKLENKATDTAELILFLDPLFDSLNGSSKIGPVSKPLKGGVTATSPHEDYWRNAIKIIDTMKFYCPQKRKFVSRPASLTNLIKTIRGFIYIKKILPEKKFDYILTRAFNQDSLENFFGSIRSHSARYNSPDVTHFISSFKALITTNFLSSHSPYSNCENTDMCELLDDLRCFLNDEEIAGVKVLEENISIPEIPNLTIRKSECLVSRELNTRGARKMWDLCPIALNIVFSEYCITERLKKNNCRGVKVFSSNAWNYTIFLNRFILNKFCSNNLEYVATQYKMITILKVCICELATSSTSKDLLQNISQSQ
ncbi:hypothetical protein NQ317_018416 [Molorchus minor]|uniref:THAP-type domain-containing protein n=1 Tax=Molorchus minor TaxID=1323400 RepID=A0ABQ9JRH4_9CUCU|nr:hypothetical protein NQ317_018416 [Molorchus minor]